MPDAARLTPPPWPVADPTIRAAIEAAFADDSWGRYDGPHCDSLVRDLREAFQVDQAITCASGTLAVEIALRAVGVAPGDEVIMAAYDYDANFLTVHALGAKPVLIDVDPHSGQLDPAHLDKAKSSSTKAIIASHLHGGLVPMKQVCEWARANDVTVIEDAAQCPGAIVDGRPAGSWGHLGTLSFGGSKLLAAGRGGAILTRDAKLAHKAKHLLSRGIQQWAALSELQAIVLRPQLARLPFDTDSRLVAVQRLTQSIGPGLTSIADLTGTPAFYKVGFWFDETTVGMARDRFCQTMREQGIAFDPGFSALHVGRSPSRFRPVDGLPNATRLHYQAVILHHPVLLAGDEAIDRVAKVIRGTYRNAV